MSIGFSGPRFETTEGSASGGLVTQVITGGATADADLDVDVIMITTAVAFNLNFPIPSDPVAFDGKTIRILYAGASLSIDGGNWTADKTAGAGGMMSLTAAWSNNDEVWNFAIDGGNLTPI